MAKRFTDTDKWKRAWFCELDVKAKLVWFYVLDQCDHRGVWFENFSLMAAQLGFRVSRQQFLNWFGAKIRPFDNDKYFIPSFVDFQYGKLNPGNNAHKSVIELVEKLAPHEDLRSPSGGAQDKEKDTDKDKDKESVLRSVEVFDFEMIYQIFPLKEGKSGGIAQCEAQIKTAGDYDRLLAATKRYRAHIEGCDRYPMMFSTFLRDGRKGKNVFPWKDWLEPETGQSSVKSSDDSLFGPGEWPGEAS